MPPDTQTDIDTGPSTDTDGDGGQGDGGQQQQEPTPAEASSALLDEVLDADISPGLYRRVDEGDVADTVALMKDRSWERLAKQDPALAERVKENAAAIEEARAAEKEEQRRQEEEAAKAHADALLESLEEEERTRIGTEAAEQARIALEESVAAEVQEIRGLTQNRSYEHIDEQSAAWEQRVGPAHTLANTLSSPDLLAAEKVDAYEQADPRTREMARQLYGIPGIYDADPTSEQYTKDFGEWKSDAEAADAWAREQKGSR